MVTGLKHVGISLVRIRIEYYYAASNSQTDTDMITGEEVLHKCIIYNIIILVITIWTVYLFFIRAEADE